jgi:hypothetical protein
MISNQIRRNERERERERERSWKLGILCLDYNFPILEIRVHNIFMIECLIELFIIVVGL